MLHPQPTGNTPAGLHAADLTFLAEVLPVDVAQSDDVASGLVEEALLACGDDLRRETFFCKLGWAVSGHLQALWAFGTITLEEATDRANAFSEHLFENPLV